MHAHPILGRTIPAIVLLSLFSAISACTGNGARLQPPTAGIQQLTVQSDGNWNLVVRFQNYSYDTGMHVYAIDAELMLDGKSAGRVAFSPALDIPAMDADIGSVSIRPDPAGATELASARRNAVAYELKGTLSVGKGTTGSPQPFKLHGRGYISPVPGVSNVWR